MSKSVIPTNSPPQGSKTADAGRGSSEYHPVATGLMDSDVSKEEITRRATQLASDAGADEQLETFMRGAQLAHNPLGFYGSDASPDEKAVWRQTQ